MKISILAESWEKKEEKEGDATDDPTDTDAKSQEEMAKEGIKKIKSFGHYRKPSAHFVNSSYTICSPQ